MTNNTAPFITIEPQNVFDTIQNDGAQEFLVRAGFSPQTILFHYNGRGMSLSASSVPSNLSINALQLLQAFHLEQEPCSMYIGTSFATYEVKEALRKLREIGEIGDQAFHESRGSYQVYLQLLSSFGPKSVSYEIQDIIKIGSENYYKKPIRERIQKIESCIGSEDAMVIGSPENVSMIVNPLYITCTKVNAPLAISTFAEDQLENLYYRIEIYGNNAYTFYHPHIKKIRDLTNVDLRVQQPLIFREYEQMVSFLQNS